jgi:hypothetical protein
MPHGADLASSPISESAFFDAVEILHDINDTSSVSAKDPIGEDPTGEQPLSAQQEYTPLAPPNTTDSQGQNLTWHTWEEAFEYIKSEAFGSGYIIVKGRA